jgi:hypothetical protein
MRRVSYHQSVFDLLDLQPPESPEARGMIEASEGRSGRRLPETVREWYLTDRVVALREDDDWDARARNQKEHLWYDYSNMDWPEPLQAVLRQFEGGLREVSDGDEKPPAGSVRVMHENQGVCRWYVLPDGSDDPAVFVDEDYDFERKQVVRWVKVADHFSSFVFDWIAGHYFEGWTPLSECSRDATGRLRSRREKPYRNGLWLYAPHAAALAPPCLDYLIENLAEGPCRQIAGGVMQYQFRNDDGRLRVTTDSYGEDGGVSAWWLHADSEEGLFHLARRVLWCSDPGKSLRHWTKAARPVIDRLRPGSANPREAQ